MRAERPQTVMLLNCHSFEQHPNSTSGAIRIRPESTSMTTDCVLMPTRSEIQTFFCSLFGTDILVKGISSKDANEQYVISDYREPSGELRYMVAIDYELANGLGAALTVIPPALAKESAARLEIPDNIRENLQEVLNVCTSLFSVCMNGHHIAIKNIFEKDNVSEEALEAMKMAAEKETFSVDLPRYQAGTMTIYRMPMEEDEQI